MTKLNPRPGKKGATPTFIVCDKPQLFENAKSTFFIMNLLKIERHQPFKIAQFKPGN